jgi:glycosyltransferase involved in cell wall biosynthesis
MSKIRILFVTTDLTTGGAEVMLYRLLMRLDQSRFEPVVLSLLDTGEWQERVEALGVKVYSLGMKRGIPNPQQVWKLVQLVRRIYPDVIQGWMYHGNIAASLAALTFPRPVVWCIHNTTELSYEKPLTAALIRAGKFFSKLTASIIYVSHRAQQQHESMGYSASQGCAIANGCETDRFFPDPSARIKIRMELGLNLDTPLIGLMARFHPMKDQANFLAAAAQMHQQYPEVHYLMAGSDITNDNPALTEQIAALGLGDRVHLLGIRQDTDRLAAALDLFSLSSAYGEALPLV